MAYTLHNGVATINLAALQKVDEGKSFGKHERQRPLQYPWGTKVSEHRWFPSQVYALRSSIDACIKDTAVQCIVVAAEGKFWCNGVDLLWVDQAPVSGAFIYIQYSVQPLHPSYSGPGGVASLHFVYADARSARTNCGVLRNRAQLQVTEVADFNRALNALFMTV